MAITREEFFNKQANASLWDVAVSIKRGNPLPLDADSIFESYEALESYAADVLAYPGQIVAVVEEDATGIYYLDQNCAIQPVGVVPTGDSKTIEVTAAGAISLLGAAGAANGTLPMIGDNGKLTWKTIEDIGAGDGNDNTTYEFSFANEKITITPKENGVAQTAIELDLSSFVTADELAEELGKLVDNDTTYSVAEGEKVLKLNDTVFSTEIGLKHENGKISLTGINGEVIAEFSDADFVKDSVLEDVEYNAETQKIVFTWKTVDGETKTDEVSVADFVQTYTAGAGLELSGNEFAVKVDSESEAFLTVGANGIKLAGVQTAIDTAAGAAKSEAIADAATKYATTSALTQLETDLDARLDTLEGINHDLYATKAELEPVATAASNAETAVGNLEQRFDEIVAVGGEPNAINKVQVNGKELTITEKTVNIEVPTALSGLEGWTELDNRVTEAKTQADKGVDEAGKANAAAATNAEEIAKHETRIGNLETAKGDHEARILGLENADTAHAAEYTALKERVDAHNETIAKKADQTALDAVSAKATTNETAIKTLNETTIPSINTEIGKKANAADVYTKTEVGTIAEGKTLVEMINEAKSEASYDDTEIRGLITAEADRATAAEQAIDGRLVKVETFFKTAEGETLDEALDTLVEIQKFITDEGTAADGMLTQIQANTTAIAAINNETTGILATAKAHAQNLFDSIPTATEGVLGLVKYDNVTIKKNDSDQLYVGQVSTDVLVNGQDEFVLNGGSAV